ncbi:hypothetical protein FAM18121_01458 [Lacticaseibacillus paracasei]|nr:hypothetical protein FAM18121_01458 [Lacticaseibacillus paracasei]
MVFDELFLDREERDRINIYSTLWEAPGHRLDIAATAITRGESYRQLRRRMEKLPQTWSRCSQTLHHYCDVAMVI